MEDYFSAGTVKELGNAIAEVELPPLDLINECNELLQDLSVNYQKEGLYQDTLNPILALAEEISEAFRTVLEILMILKLTNPLYWNNGNNSHNT